MKPPPVMTLLRSFVDGKIYGRGACDMKAGLAVNLLTVKAMLKSGIGYRGKMRLGLVCDEEDLMLGIKNYIKMGHADGTFLNYLKGTPCLVNGPGPSHIPHQTDEYVEIEELVESLQIYLLTTFRYLNNWSEPINS